MEHASFLSFTSLFTDVQAVPILPPINHTRCEFSAGAYLLSESFGRQLNRYTGRQPNQGKICMMFAKQRGVLKSRMGNT